MGRHPTHELRPGATRLVGALVVLGSLACSGAFGPKEAQPFGGPHISTVVDVDAVGDLLASAGEDRVVHVWRLPAMEGLRTIPLGDFATAVAFAPDGSRLAVASRSERVTVWNTSSWTREARLDHAGAAVAWGGRLAIASGDDIAVYDGSTLDFIGLLEGHTGSVVDLAFSADGSVLASASVDRTARTWDVGTGQETQLFAGHKAGVVTVRFGPAGRLLATGSQDKTARVWEVGSGEPVRQLSGHLDWVVGVGFPSQPNTLMTADRDGRYRVWQVADGGARAKVDLEETTIEDVLLSGDLVLLAGTGIQTVDLSEVLVEEAPPSPVARALDERCRRLLTCGKDLMRQAEPSLAARGLEVVKMAREMDLESAEICLNTLVAIPATLELAPPASCAP